MAESGHGGGGPSTERWLLTYADLITLLLAFFIIMYAGSKADLEKFSRLARGLWHFARRASRSAPEEPGSCKGATGSLSSSN